MKCMNHLKLEVRVIELLCFGLGSPSLCLVRKLLPKLVNNSLISHSKHYSHRFSFAFFLCQVDIKRISHKFVIGLA